MRITVIGCGYLGGTHAASMAELGFEVLGLDVDETRVQALSEGRVPFYEPGLEPLLRKHTESGRLSFTTSYARAAVFGEVHFLCVPTPQRDGDCAADLSYVYRSVDQLAPLLTRPCVIAGKSTVPVGTAAELARRFRNLAPAGDAVELVWNPEFLREGYAVDDTVRPDRLVFGFAPGRRDGEPAAGGSPDRDAVGASLAEMALREVYADPIAAGSPVVVCDYATAELVKVAANAFLATKISFINAMADVCEPTGADITVLADAIGHDPRIGRRFLNAGLGFGGGCLPKDIRAFMARAGELGVGEALTFLREVDAINYRRRQRVVDLAGKLLMRPWPGSRVAVLGAAFKPDSDDIRDSPALNVAGRLHLQGAHITVYDPCAMDKARRLWPTLTYADSVSDACAGAHVVLVLTEWREFRELDPEILGEIVARRAVVDGRNCLDPTRWRAAGWTYRGLGRP